jgi:hypothetical protein
MAGIKGGGKFKGWFNKINNTLRKPVLRVGYLDHATYPNGTLVAMVAAINEYGAPNARFPIPPRPWMRPAIEAGKATWPDQTGKLLVQYNYDGVKTLETMGQLVVAAMRKNIADLHSPALSPVTVMLRSMRRANPSQQVSLRTVYQAIGRVKAGKAPRAGTSVKPLVGSSNMLVTRLSYEVRRS